jgi:hypothetical protein
MLAWLIERARDDGKTFDNEKTINTCELETAMIVY